MDSKVKHHYFVGYEHRDSDYFTFTEKFGTKTYTMRSCTDVFSKNSLDYGSLVLVKTILKNNIIDGGKTLDMCCGYGTIGILLSCNLNKPVDMCDINTTSVELCCTNAKANGAVESKIFVSDMFAGVRDYYDTIVSNPPIKTGKAILLDFARGAYEHLNPNGKLVVVIKKNLGEESFKKYLMELFGNCTILERDKGYYILLSKKEK